ATAIGKTQAFRHRREEPKPQPDDVTLAHKVETIIFRNHEVPKGQISVNAEDGVVWLRGEVPTESMIEALVERTREVTGVRRVELGVEEERDQLLADRGAQVLEQHGALVAVLDERILLRHAAQVDALAHVVHVLEVLAPAQVDDLEHHEPLEVAHQALLEAL